MRQHALPRVRAVLRARRQGHLHGVGLWRGVAWCGEKGKGIGLGSTLPCLCRKQSQPSTRARRARRARVPPQTYPPTDPTLAHAHTPEPTGRRPPSLHHEANPMYTSPQTRPLGPLGPPRPPQHNPRLGPSVGRSPDLHVHARTPAPRRPRAQHHNKTPPPL